VAHENRLVTYGKRWCAYLLPLLALVVAVVQPGIGAQPETPELPTEPILRIEAGQHNGLTFSFAVDPANQFAVTASIDKSVRVWSLPEGRLLRVLRLPIDYDQVGMAYAVAVSPDSSTIAVGGYTTRGKLPDASPSTRPMSFITWLTLPTGGVSRHPSAVMVFASLTYPTAIDCYRATLNMEPWPDG
jgi:WD40 repeat protein